MRALGRVRRCIASDQFTWIGGLIVATGNTISLCDLRIGERATVVGLDGGTGFVGRMAALGFTPGATIEVARNHGRGPIIVAVLDTQIALGRGQARRVRVRRLGAPIRRGE